MAIFHLSAQVIGRSKGQSAIAAAAYRHGEKLHDERTGITHDYTRKQRVDAVEVFAPAQAPAWVQTSRLWQEAEAAERRRDAQVAREVCVALPAELTPHQRAALVQAFALECFVSAGMVADCSYHDGNGKNPHCHILLTTRRLTAQGFGEKAREWNAPEALQSWRAAWARLANAALAAANRDERVDHRTLAEQRLVALEAGEVEQAMQLDRKPTKHEGRDAQAPGKRAHNAHVRLQATRRLRELHDAWRKKLRALAARYDLPQRPVLRRRAVGLN